MMQRLLLTAGLILGVVVTSQPADATQTVAPCHKRCAPLLSLDSRSEARRTYHNCRALCDRKGTVICPDGSRKSYKNPRC